MKHKYISQHDFKSDKKGTDKIHNDNSRKEEQQCKQNSHKTPNSP